MQAKVVHTDIPQVIYGILSQQAFAAGDVSLAILYGSLGRQYGTKEAQIIFEQLVQYDILRLHVQEDKPPVIVNEDDLCKN